MKKLITSLFLFVLIKSSVTQSSGDTVRLSNNGIHPNTFSNVVSQVQAAIESCKRLDNPVIVFEKGRYDFWPDGASRGEYFISNTSTNEECPSKIKTIGMLVRDQKNLTILGNGADLIFHGKMTTVLIENSENIKLKGLNIDFERPTMSEFQVTDINPDYIEVKIHPDYRYVIENGRLSWYGDGWKCEHFHAIKYDTATQSMHYSSWMPFFYSKAVEVSTGLVHFYNIGETKLNEGDYLTVRDVIRDQVGMHILESRNISLEDLNVYYMHGLGIVSQFTENITMNQIRCAPRPGSGRLIASSADFMHFSGCKGLIKVENCLFSGAHDDPINIHGTHLRIIEQPGTDVLRVRFMHGQSYGFRAFHEGDSVEFIHANELTGFGAAKVVSVNRISDTDIELMLDKPAPAGIQKEDVLENITWTPEVIIRGCRFERTNTRGILLTTRRKALIDNNVFFRVGMSAILIADDAASWFESGMVKDVTISNNKFTDCGFNNGAAIIAIEPENKIVNINNPVHQNIRIENNTFETFNYSVVHAKSVKGLSITGNKILSTNTFTTGPGNRFPFNFNGCSNVWLGNNSIEIENDVTGCNIYIENMKVKNLKTDKMTKSQMRIVENNPLK